jgi:hypothetical protein
MRKHPVRSIFGIHVDLLKGVRGGFYFHSSDQVGTFWASPGTPERKKPLECLPSVYSIFGR